MPTTSKTCTCASDGVSEVSSKKASYSTVTLFAKFLGWSIEQPLMSAMW